MKPLFSGSLPLIGVVLLNILYKEQSLKWCQIINADLKIFILSLNLDIAEKEKFLSENLKRQAQRDNYLAVFFDFPILLWK